jgi:short-subunit dehydrogenase
MFFIKKERTFCPSTPTPPILSHSHTINTIPQLKLAVTKSQIDIGEPIDIAICNAGMCIPGLFLDQDISIFQRQLDLNLLANIQLTKLLLPDMLSRKSGHLVYVSSPLAVMGFAGYSSYCPSKWAMRGFADALRNEVQGTGVEVSVAYPPDTDTPGFAQENESKPNICVKVNDSLGVSVYPAESVAKAMVRGMRMKGRYHLPTPDLGSGMLIAAVAGLTPKPMNPVLSMLLAPILAVVTSVCRVLMDRAARKCNIEKEEER